MSDLNNSRWAPSSQRSRSPQKATSNQYIPPAPSLLYANGANTPLTPPTIPSQATSKLSKPQRELVTRHSNLLKFHKLLRRLKWKGRSLLYCHHRALHEREQNVVGGVGFTMAEGEAEMMFKIDFFEFYVLLERVLVCLLGAFGMVVTSAVGVGVGVGASGGRDNERRPDMDRSRNFRDKSPNAAVRGGGVEPKSLREELLEQRGLVGDSRMFHGYAHRFHANVLAALDLSTNPLHEIMGTGVVRDYLGIAKEFRNRWKDAEEKPADQVEDGLVGSRYEKMLNDLKLEEMLAAILVAIETARPLAEEDLLRYTGTVVDGSGLSEAMMELDEASAVDGYVDDVPWEAMPDAMDWD